MDPHPQIAEHRSMPWLTITLLSVSLVAYLYSPAAGALIFDRSAIRQGQWWRWMTGHIVHLSPIHLITDGMAFGVVATILEMVRPRFWVLLITTGAAISAFLWWALPGLALYGGLSGLAYGLAVYAAISLTESGTLWRRLGWTAIGLAAGKTLLEIMCGNSLSILSRDGFIPLAQSHAVGMITSLLYQILEKGLNKQKMMRREEPNAD
jgi:rhomboid family GlyGly-CTERM serine protease